MSDENSKFLFNTILVYKKKAISSITDCSLECVRLTFAGRYTKKKSRHAGSSPL
jgi:hypothetical protein